MRAHRRNLAGVFKQVAYRFRNVFGEWFVCQQSTVVWDDFTKIGIAVHYWRTSCSGFQERHGLVVKVVGAEHKNVVVAHGFHNGALWYASVQMYAVSQTVVLDVSAYRRKIRTVAVHVHGHRVRKLFHGFQKHQWTFLVGHA